MNDQWRRIINGSIRVYDASAQTLAKERGQSAPRLTRYLLGDGVVVEGLTLDPDLALAAVNGRLDGDRGPVLWIIADATARVLDQAMHVRLRDNPEALAIATQQIFDELGRLARILAHTLQTIMIDDLRDEALLVLQLHRVESAAMEGLVNLSRFYTCLRQSRVRQPLAHAVADSSPPTGTRIVDELGRLSEYRGWLCD